MLSLHPEYVIDEHQRTKAVMLSFGEWQQILELLEELEDIRAYDEVKSLGSEPIPFALAVREIQAGIIA